VLADVSALIFYALPIGDKTLNIHVTDALTGAGLSRKISSFLYALFFVAVNFIPAYILFRKKVFIKV